MSDYVYLCREVTSGLIKVGTSGQPSQRAYQMSIDRKAPMELVAAVKVRSPREYYERYVQSRLAEKQVEGDWFRLDQCDINEAIELLHSFKRTKPPEDRSLWPYCPWRRKPAKSLQVD